MQVYSVFSDEFRAYGQVMENYDFTELFKVLDELPMPEEGLIYVASEPQLEACAEFKEIQNRAYGGMPIQMGYCNGYNDTLNAVEYHRGPEMNITATDVVLLLGKQEEIVDGKFHSDNIKGFLLPAGTGVLLLPTALHYCPALYRKGEKFRIICCLPQGTNEGKPEFTPKGTIEEKAFSGTNTWFFAHPDSDEAAGGAYVGIEGENIKYIPEE